MYSQTSAPSTMADLAIFRPVMFFTQIKLSRYQPGGIIRLPGSDRVWAGLMWVLDSLACKSQGVRSLTCTTYKKSWGLQTLVSRAGKQVSFKVTTASSPQPSEEVCNLVIGGPFLRESLVWICCPAPRRVYPPDTEWKASVSGIDFFGHSW